MRVLLRRRFWEPSMEIACSALVKKLVVGGADRHLTDRDRTVQRVPQTAR